MNTLFAGILIAITVLPGYPCLGEETNKPFALKAGKDYVELINGDMRVKTSPGRLTTQIIGPFGNFASEGMTMPLAEIKVETDTAVEKKVSLVSTVQNSNSKGARSAVFTITLAVRTNFPGLELKALMKNVGEYAADGHFFYRLAGIKFPYYYDKDGWQSAGKPDFSETDWLFLPSAGTLGGYGLIPLNRKKSQLVTIYPREDWQPVGLYFTSPSRSQIKPGETFTLGFLIFPATSSWQVQDHMQAMPEQ